MTLKELIMENKYYTRFLLQTIAGDEIEEYNGVVELTNPENKPLEPNEVEALLAESFDIDISQIQLLAWSKLH
jgi:hypothetical protein